jgi:hypothetical protein
MLEGLAGVHSVYCFHAVIDRVRCPAFFCRGRQGDAVCRCDGAAAVNEFGIEWISADMQFHAPDQAQAASYETRTPRSNHPAPGPV